MIKIAAISILAIMICVSATTAAPLAIVDTSTVDNVNESVNDKDVATDDTVNESVNDKNAEAELPADFDIDLNDAQDFLTYAEEDVVAPSHRLGVVRRNHNYGQQIKLAVVMMTFILAALASSQSWNPR